MLNFFNKDLGLEYFFFFNDLDYVSINFLDDNFVDVDKNSEEIKEYRLLYILLELDLEFLSVVLLRQQVGVSGQLEGLFYINVGLDIIDL